MSLPIESNKRKHSNNIQINDLIDVAINNAVARRNQTFTDISDEAAGNISGGGTNSLPTIHGVIIKPHPPIIHGIIIDPHPPVIHGVIIKPGIISG